VTEDAKYRPQPKANEVQHGGNVIADQPFGCVAMSMISNADGSVTTRRGPFQSITFHRCQLGKEATVQ